MIIFKFLASKVESLVSYIEGWPPRVVYGFLGVSKESLAYWHKNIYPKIKKKNYSTYDILIYMIIRDFVNEGGLSSKGLSFLNWKKTHNTFEEHTLNGLKKLYLNINFDDDEINLYSSLNDFNHLKHTNHHLELKNYAMDLKSALEISGCENADIYQFNRKQRLIDEEEE